MVKKISIIALVLFSLSGFSKGHSEPLLKTIAIDNVEFGGGGGPIIDIMPADPPGKNL